MPDTINGAPVDVYDAAIIGAGPAGLSAALTLRAHNKTILWLGNDQLSMKVEKAELIANYAGVLPLPGNELNDRFRAQMKEAGLVLVDQKVTQVTKRKKYFMLLADNDIYKAKTVLFAIGAVNAKGLPGEQELLGRGVSYCATCDGFLYKGKTIAVVCGEKRFEHEVKYLAEVAQHVYLQARYEGAQVEAPNVEKLSLPIRAVVGTSAAEGVELTDGSVRKVDGVFFLRSAVAPATILSGLETDGAHIVVNRACETNVPGCYAAGDCTGRPYQIAKAVGEGNVAAHGMVEYLAGINEG